jgi:hypothetical protein
MKSNGNVSPVKRIITTLWSRYINIWAFIEVKFQKPRIDIDKKIGSQKNRVILYRFFKISKKGSMVFAI